MYAYFYQINITLALVMVASICAFSLSITDKQMESKDKDGKIAFNKFQKAMVNVFLYSLYVMLLTAGYTISKGISAWLIT